MDWGLGFQALFRWGLPQSHGRQLTAKTSRSRIEFEWLVEAGSRQLRSEN